MHSFITIISQWYSLKNPPASTNSPGGRPAGGWWNTLVSHDLSIGETPCSTHHFAHHFWKTISCRSGIPHDSCRFNPWVAHRFDVHSETHDNGQSTGGHEFLKLAEMVCWNQLKPANWSFPTMGEPQSPWFSILRPQGRCWNTPSPFAQRHLVIWASSLRTCV